MKTNEAKLGKKRWKDFQLEESKEVSYSEKKREKDSVVTAANQLAIYYVTCCPSRLAQWDLTIQQPKETTKKPNKKQRGGSFGKAMNIELVLSKT